MELPSVPLSLLRDARHVHTGKPSHLCDAKNMHVFCLSDTRHMHVKLSIYKTFTHKCKVFHLQIGKITLYMYTGGHQRNYREIALTLICSFATSGTFCGSGIVTEKPDKGSYSRLF